jgi:hypothetical protein
MHSLPSIAEQPLITFLMVTNGRSPHLRASLDRWFAVAKPGEDFFVCGPAEQLKPFGLAPSSVVNYPDSPDEDPFFCINKKKSLGAGAVPGQYVYILHDRMLPPDDIFEVLYQHLSSGRYRFGAMNVDNTDGSASLRPLRVDRRIIGASLDDALNRRMRFGVPDSDPHASEHVALNGAQFFLHRDLLHHLERPLRWFEMEDDILSHDLMEDAGIWITDATLTSCVTKKLGQPQPGYQALVKRAGYTALCLRSWLAVRRQGHRNILMSVRHQSSPSLRQRLGQELFLIDPLHKFAASDVLPSSLERTMARARLLSEGHRFNKVSKVEHGWRLW